MSNVSVLEEIDIPDSARQAKPWFKDRPGADIVREIKEFVAETGKPHLWRGHTHTKPAQGANVMYLGEFDLPASCKHRWHWAPCPCCCPTHPKYRTEGKIAWFPDEAAIRLIGPDCFAALNPEGHEFALQVFRAEQQQEKDIAYLLRSLPVVPQALTAINAALPIALAVDEFRTALRSRLDNTLQLPLWREVGGGELRLYVRRREVVRRRDGSEGERWVDDRTRYAAIHGVSLLNPSSHQFAPRLKTAAEKLASIRFDDYEKAVAGMADSQRTAAAKTLGRSIGRAGDTFEEMEEARRFASPITVATLRNWALQDGSPFPLYIERVDADFYIGRTEDQKLHIPIAPAFNEPLPALPSLSDTEL